MEGWDVAQSKELFRIQDWGGGYFDINTEGNVVVKPNKMGPGCDLYKLVGSLKARGIEAPILFRFEGIIADRVKLLQQAFQEISDTWGYKGVYRVTFPVKVNPLRNVVEAVRSSGHLRHLGLECGSKPELLALLAVHELPDAPFICNGYKDSEYIELALLGRKLGRRTIIVVEQLYELKQVIDASAALGIEPEIGFRMKPSTKGAGIWAESGGEQAKFGLNTQEIISAVNTLQAIGKTHWLKLLHFHIGSQIPALGALRKVMREASRMYVELHRLCPSLSILDVGGGLGIDYDGSKSNFEHSVNYSVDEYAEAVVSTLYEACEAAEIPHPDIVSESGRALVAHHAVLVAEVIDTSPALYGEPPTDACPFEDELLQRLRELYHEVTLKNFNAILNEATLLREDIFEQFMHGNIDLEGRAYAERVFRHLLIKMSGLTLSMRHIPEEFEKISSVLRDTYFCNFSLFQSMLDSWAIDQLFPVMPIQRLGEEPERKAILADLTCDSDGVIDRFIDLKDVNNYLACHTPKDEFPYYVGVFLVGAYQEILGGLHNLFGDTNAVHVNINEAGEAVLTNIVRGDQIREVLNYVEYDIQELTYRVWQGLEKGIRNGEVTAEESARFQKRYKEALEGYTYLVK